MKTAKLYENIDYSAETFFDLNSSGGEILGLFTNTLKSFTVAHVSSLTSTTTGSTLSSSKTYGAVFTSHMSASCIDGDHSELSGLTATTLLPNANVNELIPSNSDE